MKKDILLIHFGKISALPPALAILDSFVDEGNYVITVLASEYDPEIDEIYTKKGVNFIHCYDRVLSRNALYRKFQIIKYDYIFYNCVKRAMAAKKYDYIWVLHEVTAIRIAHLLKIPFILTTYELNDKNPFLTKRLIPIANKATINVVCEYNRAHIMRAQYHLKKLPYVIPNKPVIHPRKRDLPTGTVVNNIKEKIVLYQGQMYAHERNLEALCKAVCSMEGYKLVLMGSKNTYTESLCAKYPSIVHIDYIKAPYHLNVTSHAYIGYVSYSSNALNTLYCAPNKIWEYAGFGIPMIANDIPGLKYTVGASGAGLCIDTDDVDAIVSAISTIDKNYNEFSRHSLAFYETCNVSLLLHKVLDAFDYAQSYN